MNELITWCISLFNPFVIVLALALIPSIVFNISSFKALTKEYVIHWQWILRKEKKPDTPTDNSQGELDTDKQPSSFYKVIAITLAILLVALTTLYIVNIT